MLTNTHSAKYPLAHIAKPMDVLEDCLCFGSDIGCALKKTISTSSLGPRFEEKSCKCVVNAFHGYSHNWACQKVNHPNVVTGLGLEDLETLERVFSASNAVAAVTRYTTAFHRRVYIDQFCQQWDEDKYLNLANMLYCNYVQALEIIKTDQPALQHVLETMGITTEEIQKWEEEEVHFIEELGHEPEGNVHAMAYIELLQGYRDAE